MKLHCEKGEHPSNTAHDIIGWLYIAATHMARLHACLSMQFTRIHLGLMLMNIQTTLQQHGEANLTYVGSPHLPLTPQCSGIYGV